jgi:ABC-type branched-subunit amino acid transport system substrate-binding protein
MSWTRRAALVGAGALFVSILPHAAFAGQSTKGDPVTIYTIGEYEVAVAGSANPEVSGAVEARAKAINKAGGLKDAAGTTHKLKVVVCNTNNDPNRAEQCARDAVEDEAAAVVGTYTTLGSSVYPILEAASIPVVGSTGSEPTPFTSPISFTNNSGLPGLFFNMPSYLAEDGATSLSLVLPDLAAAAQVAPLIKQAAEAAGAPVVNELSVPLDTADLAPQISASMANDVDGMILLVIGDQNGRFIQGLEQQGFDGKIATAGPFLTPDILGEVGDYLNGKALVELAYPPVTAKSVPGIKQYLKDMNAFDKSLIKNDQGVGNWLSTYIFEQAAEQTDEITGANILATLNGMTDVDTLGLTPPIDYTQPAEVAQFPLPRLFVSTIVHGAVKKGKIVSASKPPEFVEAFG